MRADIFPDLDLPVIYVAQPYGGMSPAQMEGYITYYYEYHFLYVNASRASSRNRFRHQPAEADVSRRHRHGGGAGADHRLRESSPRLHAPGTVGPFIMRSMPGPCRLATCVLEREPEPGRDSGSGVEPRAPAFATLPGLTSPPPFGGSQRTIVIRVDPDRLRSYGMSPDEVIRAVTAAT